MRQLTIFALRASVAPNKQKHKQTGDGGTAALPRLSHCWTHRRPTSGTTCSERARSPLAWKRSLVRLLAYVCLAPMGSIVHTIRHSCVSRHACKLLLIATSACHVTLEGAFHLLAYDVTAYDEFDGEKRTSVEGKIVVPRTDKECCHCRSSDWSPTTVL
jgi:hypothetical protein